MIDTADWRALGTGVRLVVHGGDLRAARRAVETVLDDVDRAFSRFRADSELSAVNADPGVTHPVGSLLGRAIEGAIEASRWTGGAVDPSVGGALRIVGYDRDFDDVRASARPIELRLEPVPGWRSIAYDAQTRSLRAGPGVAIDLGATGKGLAADLAAAAAVAALAPDAGALVGLGGDIAVAGRAPEGGWRIRVGEDSATPVDAPGEVIAIDGGAVATSTTTVRRWTTSSGAGLHHILDPRTGLPAVTRWRTASVAAATCELANAASTAAIVLGERAPAWLEANGLPARLVATDGRIVRLAGWPEPDKRLAQAS
jgi:thiamine biosynthesis lipoprotein